MAVAGSPGRGAVHVVEAVPALGRDSVTVVNGVSVRSRHRDTADIWDSGTIRML